MRGKFRRLCEPKRNSGKIEVDEDIFKLYEAKGASREKLFEAFIKVNGDKDQGVFGKLTMFMQTIKHAVYSPSKLDSLCLHKGLLEA